MKTSLKTTCVILLALILGAFVDTINELKVYKGQLKYQIIYACVLEDNNSLLRDSIVMLNDKYDHLAHQYLIHEARVDTFIQKVYIDREKFVYKNKPVVVVDKKGFYKSQKNLKQAIAYIERFKMVAVSEQEKFGIPASITLAQGLLESGRGTSGLAKNANNHFGIKYFGQKHIHEHIKPLVVGNYYLHDDCCKSKKCKKPEPFIHYKSAWSSYRAHSYFLQKPRYAKLAKFTDYKNWAKGLSKAGYATDPKYATKLINIIEQLQLNKYDV